MSKRLQVVLEEDDLQLYDRCAKARGLTLSEWVRQSLRRSASDSAIGDVDAKLGAVRRAFGFSFPTADIEEMGRQIELGYELPPAGADRPQ